MSARRSAGLLPYRIRDGQLEVLLVHPGGPYWAKKDQGAWSIPKGEHGEDEDALDAARRELEEETGFRGAGEVLALGVVRQPGGKLVRAWAVAADVDETALVSNRFEMEWPPRSGRMRSFPEVDRAAWFSPEEARQRILKGQVDLLDRLRDQLAGGTARDADDHLGTGRDRR